MAGSNNLARASDECNQAMANEDILVEHFMCAAVQ